MRRLTLATGILASGLLAGCVVGPNYHRPPVQAPAAYKTEGPWRVAAPKDAIPKGAWWEIFNDAELNAYEQQLLNANQSLAAAKDRLSEARSLARVASAGYFPTVSTDPNASRQRYSGHRPEVVTLGRPLTQNTYEVPFLLNYEPDLFGKVRRTLEASNASLQSTAADLYNVNLVLTAELAADYFSLRELDAETQVVQESVAIQQKGTATGRGPPRGRCSFRTRPGAAEDPARLHGDAALPGPAAARAIRARHRRAHRKPSFYIQRTCQTFECDSAASSAGRAF